MKEKVETLEAENETKNELINDLKIEIDELKSYENKTQNLNKKILKISN